MPITGINEKTNKCLEPITAPSGKIKKASKLFLTINATYQARNLTVKPY